MTEVEEEEASASCCTAARPSVALPEGKLDPVSIVCKVTEADGRPTVKLSANPTKAQGPADEVARYRRVFAVGEQEALPVLV